MPTFTALAAALALALVGLLNPAAAQRTLPPTSCNDVLRGVGGLPPVVDLPLCSRGALDCTQLVYSLSCPFSCNHPLCATYAPSGAPSGAPTASDPTAAPTTPQPSPSPTPFPTPTPTLAPSTSGPTAAPTTSGPTTAPTTSSPTQAPSPAPTPAPTPAPSAHPSSNPTAAPTAVPTSTPTAMPTSSPPTSAPTAQPTRLPSKVPSSHCLHVSDDFPRAQCQAWQSRGLCEHSNSNVSLTVRARCASTCTGCTQQPTAMPTALPSMSPTSSTPTASPTMRPTANPTARPTARPTAHPTAHPTVNPTPNPTRTPTDNPTRTPTVNPTPSPVSCGFRHAQNDPDFRDTIPLSSCLAVLDEAMCGDDQFGGRCRVTCSGCSHVPTQSPTDAPSSSLPTRAPTVVPTISPTRCGDRFRLDSNFRDLAELAVCSEAYRLSLCGADAFHGNCLVTCAGCTAPPTTAGPTKAPTYSPVPCSTHWRGDGDGRGSSTDVLLTATCRIGLRQGRCSDAVFATSSCPWTCSECVTLSPSTVPTSSQPTAVPTKLPTTSPTDLPTRDPTVTPSANPTSNWPTIAPTNLPTSLPTNLPTALPTNLPTTLPTNLPTTLPTNLPTTLPTNLPTTSPTNLPTLDPTVAPSANPEENVASSSDAGTSLGASAYVVIIVVVLIVIVLVIFAVRHSVSSSSKRASYSADDVAAMSPANSDNHWVQETMFPGHLGARHTLNPLARQDRARTNAAAHYLRLLEAYYARHAPGEKTTVDLNPIAEHCVEEVGFSWLDDPLRSKYGQSLAEFRAEMPTVDVAVTLSRPGRHVNFGFDLLSTTGQTHDSQHFISEVHSAGVADGALRHDDRLISVNGMDADGWPQSEVIAMIAQSVKLDLVLERVGSHVEELQASSTEMTVELSRPSLQQGFGFGLGQSEHELNHVISQVAPASLAAGSLNPDDRVVTVNGVEVDELSHSEVLTLIGQSTILHLRIERITLPLVTRSFTITRASQTASFGFGLCETLHGGHHVVTQVSPGGPAEGLLRPDDRVVKVNGVAVDGVPHEHVLSSIAGGLSFTVEIERGTTSVVRKVGDVPQRFKNKRESVGRVDMCNMTPAPPGGGGYGGVGGATPLPWMPDRRKSVDDNIMDAFSMAAAQQQTTDAASVERPAYDRGQALETERGRAAAALDLAVNHWERDISVVDSIVSAGPVAEQSPAYTPGKMPFPMYRDEQKALPPADASAHRAVSPQSMAPSVGALSATSYITIDGFDPMGAAPAPMPSAGSYLTMHPGTNDSGSGLFRDPRMIDAYQTSAPLPWLQPHSPTAPAGSYGTVPQDSGEILQGFKFSN